MPLKIEIFPELEIVLTIATGVVTDQAVLDHDRALEKMRQFEPRFNHILDVTAMSENLLTLAGLKEIAEKTPFSPQCRRAYILVGNDAAKTAGVFAELTNMQSDQLYVTHDRESAYKWLLEE